MVIWPEHRELPSAYLSQPLIVSEGSQHHENRFPTGCGGRGSNMPPHAQPFSLVSMTSKNLVVVTKSCIPLIRSQIFLQFARSALLRLEASLMGCAERSAWCGFTRTG